MVEPPKPQQQIDDDPPELARAVDDIASKDADELLAAQDAELAAVFKQKEKPSGLWAKLKHTLKSWWDNPKARWGTIAGVAVALLIVGTVPTSRYFVLNNVGVRSSASVLVLDASTQQPLKNVQVSLANQTAKTDNEGVAQLSHVKLGGTKLVIERRAFAPVERAVTVGWGSNPLGETQLTPTGTQYRFVAKDFLSGEPLAKAEVRSGEAQARANEEGEIVLTIDENPADELPVEVTSQGYRTEELTISLDDQSVREVAMAPARKHAFISKRSGKFDVYAIDVDGKNETLLLAGSGFERDDMVLAPHPNSDLVAVISTRDNVRNSDGFLLSGLGIIDTKNDDMVNVAQSERIQLVDWIGDRLVFVQVAAGASANDPKRQRLMSYDYETGQSTELASSNRFNDVLAAKDAVYYAPSGSSAGLYRVNADGSSHQALLNQQVWNIFRTDYDQANLSVGQDWFTYTFGDAQAAKISGPPADLKNRLYHNDNSSTKSLWVDDRDGKGVLLEHDVEKGTDRDIHSQSGLQNPVAWLTDKYVVYRVSTDQETADYVLNLEGGEPRKITDVTNSRGIDQWYYY